MVAVNVVILGGNLTRDPEVRYTPQGTAIASFGLAVNRTFRTREGDQKEEVCYIEVETWGRQAETCGEYLTKGRSVLVEGRLKLDTWENKEGQKRSRHKVTAQRVHFLGSRPAGDKTGAEDVAPPPAPYEELSPPPAPEGGKDDIPF